MAKLIPFNGTVIELYRQYGKVCFIGTMTGYGVAGFSDGRDFHDGGQLIEEVSHVQISGFVILS